MRSKKGFLVVMSVLVALIMVTTTFTQVLGKSNESKAYQTKTSMGYVDKQGDLVTYNLEGVQQEDHPDPSEVIAYVQGQEDYQMLIDEVEAKDAEDTGDIDPQFEDLRNNLAGADPLVLLVSFNNDKLPQEQTGGVTGTTMINMVTLSLRSSNNHDVHITYSYDDLTYNEKMVVGVVTNNDASIDTAGLEHQVFYVHCILIKPHGLIYRPIYWRIWWYDSHHHPNWFYGWYFWYWRYFWYWHNPWVPWYTWWWCWYYWHYWWFWSTWWPYW